jgi:hypothetical protein
MAFPVTLNGRTYTLADFEGLNYVEGFPDALEDFVTDAGAASTSATNAASSATAAASSATAAAASATSAAASLDAIEGFYLGAAASDPTTDLNGDALTAGDWYFNTGSDALKVYNGSTFITFSALTFDLVDDTTPQLGGNLDLNGNTVGGVDATELAILDGATVTTAELNILDGVTATAAEINYLDIATLGATEASKAVTADANGVVTFDDGISEEYGAVTSSSNSTTVDLQSGTNFSHTLTENTTFTFSNPAASGKVSAFTLKIVQDASASGYTVTWPAAVDWPSATAPTLTATASAVDYFVFITHDGGTTWYGFTAGQAFG